MKIISVVLRDFIPINTRKLHRTVRPLKANYSFSTGIDETKEYREIVGLLIIHCSLCHSVLSGQDLISMDICDLQGAGSK